MLAEATVPLFSLNGSNVSCLPTPGMSPYPYPLSAYSDEIIFHLWKCLRSSVFHLHHVICPHVPLPRPLLLLKFIASGRAKHGKTMSLAQGPTLNHARDLNPGPGKTKQNMNRWGCCKAKWDVALEWEDGSKDSGDRPRDKTFCWYPVSFLGISISSLTKWG